MNKKQILDSIWDYLIERMSWDWECIPTEPGQHTIIQFNMHLKYGPTAKTFLKHVKKREKEEMDKIADEMFKEFNNNDDSTDGN